MDIISHSLTGIAIGTLFATISNSSWQRKGLIILSGGIGGALPDLDAISMWSKFDSTIGTIFNLKYLGKDIYFGKYWYSHHAAFHSILAPIILILFYMTLINVFNNRLKTRQTLDSFKEKKLTILTFFFGYTFHLLEDMPTPESVWGGVNLLYPNSNYIGGYGKIWWWNNYDLVLIICGVITINLLINIFPKKYFYVKVSTSIIIFTIGLFFFLFQINTRPVDFSYTGYSKNYNNYELQSKQIQKKILGEKIYNIMSKIDNKIPLNF